MKTLNESFTSLSMRRRYEVWFLRLGLADGSGAWWFRYLLTSPGRGGCGEEPNRQPVQVWATWFPHTGKPATWIAGFPIRDLRLSPRGSSPFFLEAGENSITENECRGNLKSNGRSIRWDFRYRSSFRVQLSSKGWIGFSRTPHSDAIFSGEITLDGQPFRGNPLGYGVQGHNCGYRHRKFWAWTHLHFSRPNGGSSTFEALVYEMPLGLVFRRAVLWHEGSQHVFNDMTQFERDPHQMIWSFCCPNAKFRSISVSVKGREGSIHRLPYLRTDCSGQFEVTNDSLAVAEATIYHPGKVFEGLTTDVGAVLEMGGASAR